MLQLIKFSLTYIHRVIYLLWVWVSTLGVQ